MSISHAIWPNPLLWNKNGAYNHFDGSVDMLLWIGSVSIGCSAFGDDCDDRAASAYDRFCPHAKYYELWRVQCANKPSCDCSAYGPSTVCAGNDSTLGASSSYNAYKYWNTHDHAGNDDVRLGRRDNTGFPWANDNPNRAVSKDCLITNVYEWPGTCDGGIYALQPGVVIFTVKP